MMMNHSSSPTNWSKHVQLDDQKRGLARLMARENITVEHGAYETASFDVETRVLRLPLWDNVTLDQYDLLIGHEVGHALYSDDLSFIDDCKAAPGLHTFINVLEDVRIERRIKDAFPGMQGAFQRGYRDFFEHGPLFQLTKPVAEYSFIDRINIHYKIGAHVTVPFTDDERAILAKVDATRTMGDVIALAKELYGAAKSEQKKQNPESGSQSSKPSSDETTGQSPTAKSSDSESNSESDSESNSESDSESDSESNSKSDSESNSESDSESDSESESSSDSESDSESESSSDATSESDVTSDAPHAETDMANAAAMKTMQSATSDVRTVTHVPLTKSEADAYTVSVADVVREAVRIETQYATRATSITASLETLTRQYAPTAAHMAREFERRKSAKQLERARVATTGRLNLKKLPFYQFREDLFQQVTILPNGQSHGLMLLIDGSGSMSGVFPDVIEQVFLFGLFAKQVRIPVQAFVFQTSYHSPLMPNAQRLMPRAVQLVTVLDTTSKVPIAAQLRSLAQLHCAFSGFDAHLAPYVRLAATPLYGGMLVMETHVLRMRESLGLQKMTVMVLTDGEDSDGLYAGEQRISSSPGAARVIVRDTLTHRTFVGFTDAPDTYWGYTTDRHLLNRLMHHVYTVGLGVSLIRLYIGRDSDCRSHRAVGTMASALGSLTDAKDVYQVAAPYGARLADDKIAAVTRKDLPSLFADTAIIVSNRKLDMQDDTFEDLDTSTMTNRRIMSAFTKSNVAAAQNRVLINAVMPFIA